MPTPSPRRHFGLRARITFTFALGAALLSAVLSVITWGLTRENLLRQRDETAVTRVFSNALTVQKTLGGPAVATGDLISSLPTPEGAQQLLFYEDAWTGRNTVVFGPESVPPSLRGEVVEGRVAKMRYQVDGIPHLVVGVPIADTGAEYYEAVSLAQVDATLDGLAISLLGAAAITVLAGGLLGFWASRRALLPLAEVGTAAEAIAGGRLDTRIPDDEDPDLAAITAAFNDMAEALQARVERDTRFANEVSHELRSPLMTVQASVEVLDNQRDEMPERARAALDLLTGDMDRFRQLVEDLLEISRVDVGAVHLHLAPAVATELVLQAVNTASTVGVPVHYEDDVADTLVAVDKVRFFRIIGNLLDNASKYASGATSVHVESAVGVEGEPTVRICVEDAGHGVPEEERLRIFDRFSRGTEGGNRGADSGTGLGLAIVDELVRLHGGRIWVEDRVDRRAGARFVIELPSVPPSAEGGDGPHEGQADWDDAAAPLEAGPR